MAHLVENMLSVRKAPWHKLGVILDNPPTVVQAIRLAGLDWTVEREPLQLVCDGRKVEAFATVRSTDKSILGVVGTQYRPLQNVEAFQWFQPFLDGAEASIETAGSLAEGKRVWVLAKLNRSPLEIAAGDIVEKFILLSNSHDGTLAVRVGFTPIRVVCNNTLSMAHRSDASKLIRVKHSSKVKENLNAIREVMDLANQQFEATAEQYRRLACKTISQADVRKYVREVFQADDDPSPRMRNILSDCCRLFEAGQGNDLPAVRGTLWAAYNGLSEWLGTQRGSTDDGRLNSLWFGDSARLNQRALELALSLAV
jgi:phage/plasmid-like protein (TIGR03299 family)